MAHAGPCTLERARAARARARRWLQEHGLEGAVGTAREGGGFVVKASLARALPPGVAAPAEVDGVPLRLEVTGRARARKTR